MQYRANISNMGSYRSPFAELAYVKQCEDFNRYARFITKKFDVNVVFESREAKADAHRTIYLPDLQGLSARDIEFLYGLLLHEAGHIAYSDYSEKYAKQIISQSHFLICNALEDARMENCVMNDYDGAHDIFQSLYLDFANDHKFMQKLFGFNPKKADFWHYLNIFLHDYYVNLRTKLPVEKVYGTVNAKNLNKFIKKYNILDLLQNTKLKTSDDVYSLGLKIYNLAIQYAADRSPKYDVKEQIKAKNQMTKTLSDLLDGLKDLEKEIQEIKDQLKDLKPVVNKIQTERSIKLEKLNKEYDKLDADIRANKNKLNTHEKGSRALSESIESENRKKKYEDIKKDLERKLEDLKNQLANTTDAKQQQKLQKKHDKTEKDINYREGQIQKQDKLYEKRNQKSEQFETMTAEEVKELRDRLAADMKAKEALDKEYKDVNTSTAEEREYSNLDMKLDERESRFEKKTVEGLKQVQSKAAEQGIPLNAIPEFEPNEEWPESDAAQKQFDERASAESGQIVNNGCGMHLGSPRNILALIDQSINDVVEFNVAEHFAALHRDDKLEDFNQDLIRNTARSNDLTNTQITTRLHVPLTTQYDRVVNKNRSTGIEVSKIKQKQASNIARIKQIFRTRLKFSRRDSFRGNQDEGFLDTRSIWKIAAKSDDDRVFETIVPKFVNKVAASICVDVSGSQDKDFTNHGNKLKEIALMLSEGLTEVHIKHDILGLHAPVSSEMRAIPASSVAYNRRSNLLETIVYKNVDEKSQNGIDNMDLECSDNSDGESLRIVANRLLKRNAKSRLMFYVTDGKPFLSDANLDVLDQDLLNTINWLKKAKIKLYVFGFNAEGKKFYGDSYCYIKDWSDLLSFCHSKM